MRTCQRRQDHADSGRRFCRDGAGLQRARQTAAQVCRRVGGQIAGADTGQEQIEGKVGNEAVRAVGERKRNLRVRGIQRRRPVK